MNETESITFEDLDIWSTSNIHNSFAAILETVLVRGLYPDDCYTMVR